MRVHTKLMVLIVLVTLISLSGFLFYEFRSALNKSYLFQAEKNEETQSFKRILLNEESYLTSILQTYSRWDEIINYLSGQKSLEWEKVYLESIPEKFNLNAVWLFNKNGNLQYNHRTFSDFPIEQFHPDKETLDNLFASNSIVHFYQRTEYGLLEIFGTSLHHFEESTEEPATQGYLFIGRAVNDDYIRNLAILTGGKIRLVSQAYAQNNMSQQGMNYISIYQPISDIHGIPLQSIELTLERGYFYKTQQNMKNVLIIALAYFIGTTLIVFYLFLKWINQPISRLSAAMKGKNPSVVAPLSHRTDEFGDLARLVADFFEQRDKLIQENQSRREAETTLNWKNDFQQRLLDTVPIPLFYTDDAGLYLGCNQAYEKFFELPRYSLIGKSLSDIYDPDTITQFSDINEALLTQGGEHRYEGPIVLCDGTSRDVIALKAAYLNKKGEIAGVVGTFQDITDIRKMEKSIRKNESRLKTILEASMDAVFLETLEGTIIDSNSAATRIYGYTRDEFLNINVIQNLIADAKYSQHKKNIQEKLLNGGFYAETLNRRKNGEIFPCEVRVQLATLEGDDVLVVYVRDITLQKRIREQILAQRDLALSIAAASSIEESLPTCLKTAIKLSEMEGGGIYLFDTKTQELILTTHQGFSDKFVESVRIIKPQDSRYLQVMRGLPLYLSISEPHSLDANSFSGEEGFKSLAIVPLLSQGKVIGSFNLASFTLEIVPEESRNILEAVAAQVGSAISRIQAQEELKLSESNYRTIFNASHDAILLLDKETGKIIDINQSGLTLFGLKHSEALKIAINELGSFDITEKTEALEWLFRATKGHTQVFEWKLARPDRTPLWVEVTLKQTYIQGKECILSVMRDISERKSSEEALRETNDILNALIQASPAAIVAIDREGIVRQWNPAARNIFGWSSDEIVGKFNPILSLEDIEKHHIFEIHSAMETAHGIELKTKRKDARTIEISLHSAPLSDATGDVVGMMGVIEDITERKIAERQLQHAAFYDTLTGLPNRPFFMDRLHYSLARSKRTKDFLFAVLFLDLDRFKEINDTLGHMVGDQILIQVSHRLRRCIRETDLLARLGGDEFTILMEDIRQPTDTTLLAERILKELSEPYIWQNREIYTTASIGIALSKKEEGIYETAEDILRDSDTAMYQAKENGRERYEIFDQTMHESIKSMMEIEMDLRRALERKELRLFYQPIMNIRKRKLFGFEALLYWEHPEKGLLNPSTFINVAEDTGLIIPIGEWVIREACHQMMLWKTKYPQFKDLTIGVNVSPRQFDFTGFVNRIKYILEETGLDPKFLNMEITESAVLRDKNKVLPVIQTLKEIGVQIHMDDFGTGYSSLNYLLCFPIDRVKIGQDFLINMGLGDRNKDLVHSIINLAQALRVEVIAEGVETINHLEFLENENCEMGQGYLFAKPLSPDDAEAYLNSDINK